MYIYTNLRDWGLGISIYLDGKESYVSIDFGPWDIEWSF